jgi:hypothetical protein
MKGILMKIHHWLQTWTNTSTKQHERFVDLLPLALWRHVYSFIDKKVYYKLFCNETSDYYDTTKINPYGFVMSKFLYQWYVDSFSSCAVTIYKRYEDNAAVTYYRKFYWKFWNKPERKFIESKFGHEYILVTWEPDHPWTDFGPNICINCSFSLTSQEYGIPMYFVYTKL